MCKKLFCLMTVVSALSLLTAAASADELPVTDGLELRFDASAITGLDSCARISSWNDTSGNNRHASGGGGDATYGENQTVTGLNTVTFHGTRDEKMGFNYNPNDKDITIIAVACSRVTTGGVFPNWLATYIGWQEIAGNGLVHHSFNKDRTVVMLGADDRGEPLRIGVTHDPNVDGFTINTARLNSPAGVEDIFRDGILLARYSEVEAHGVTHAQSSGHLGGIEWYGDWEGGWDGDLAEVLVYSRALSEAERQAVERYLYKKWVWRLEAHYPSPADGATEAERPAALTLSWMPGRKAAEHDVYLGTNFDDVNDANTLDLTGIYRGRQDATTYNAGALELGQSYYWRVDEVNDLCPDSPWKGDVWSFTTANYLIVDDFEDYNDFSPDRIFETWIDGFGYKEPPPGHPGNGTGSIVGHFEPPYAEQTIVHGGTQSMPYEYDNNKQGYSKYSEASLTLSYPRDWTEEGVKALALWFRGRPGSLGSFVEGPAGTYTMSGAGADIWGTYDEFHFAYKQVTGACTITAKLESMEETDKFAKAGVMIRDTLDPDSKYAMMAVMPGVGVSFQRRTETGGTTKRSMKVGIAAPQWVKLERSLVVGGVSVSAYYSADGSDGSWVQLGSAETVNMTTPFYVGLAVTSHDAAVPCEAVFSNVTITDTVTGDWVNHDIGIRSNTPEPMYVAVADSSGTTAVVYDPNAAIISDWKEWNIELKDFSDAGVDLNDVNSISIGFGDRDDAQPGGKGVVYFDDIRLYPRKCAPDLVDRPAGDVTNDCVVDYADLEMMADNWLFSDYNLAGLDGTLINFPDDDSQWVDGALQFDEKEKEHYVDCGNDPNLDITRNLTLAFWAKLDTVYNWLHPIDRSGAKGRTYVAYFWTGGWQLSRTYVPGGTADLGMGLDVGTILGEWHHWAISDSFDEMEVRAYKDGSLGRTSSTPSEALLAVSNPDVSTIIGGIVKGVEGALDEVRIYDCALSENEIKYLAGVGGVEPAQAPVLWYKFDETSGLTADDSGAYAGKLTYVPLPQPEVDLYEDGKVDFKDYALLADTWLDEQLWP